MVPFSTHRVTYTYISNPAGRQTERDRPPNKQTNKQE